MEDSTRIDGGNTIAKSGSKHSHIPLVFGKVFGILLQCNSHSNYACYVFRSSSHTRFLKTSLLEGLERRPSSDEEKAYPLGTVELMCRCRKKIYVKFLYVYWDVPDGLNCIRMEKGMATMCDL